MSIFCSLKLGEDHRVKLYENRVLRRIHDPGGGGELKGSWRRLHNEELHNLYISTNIITVIISKIMRWDRHGACIRLEMYTIFCLENLKEKDH
jgi:hypothetical protein